MEIMVFRAQEMSELLATIVSGNKHESQSLDQKNVFVSYE